MKYQDKLKSIPAINSDLDYLKGEYSSIKLWGGIDEPVSFESLMDWLHKNKHIVEHMISLNDKLKDTMGING